MVGPHVTGDGSVIVQLVLAKIAVEALEHALWCGGAAVGKTAGGRMGQSGGNDRQRTNNESRLWGSGSDEGGDGEGGGRGWDESRMGTGRG